ncbi:FAD-dependent oxidoreductase [Paenibacillus sp. GCM10023248]|uniref:FAD-dependent oxidoreductase n=1 Tax=unclassified Paenibacillus TaxID=185978 RepID=UPI00237879DF|nr:NAD(P)/FAD-dependent oxidoreductase [Paenibacillus sp. MAHUQ-63]MDD9266086.1 NAD(P)/FAD-dependent oxidoreductase [Paenibacillus sp. MAHUQ-63]
MNYDVIVVGARVAGSSLAYELSQAGFKVLLVERSVFPSDMLSTHNFFNNSVAMLREMGVLDKLLQTGTPLYRRAYVRMDDAVIDGLYPEVSGESCCLCIRRKYLDSILFEHAAASPLVTAIQGFRVTDVLRQGDTVTGIAGVGRDGRREQFTARLVVGADGRHSTVRDLVRSERIMAVPTDYASYVGYFSGYRQEGEPCVEFYKMRDRLAILFPTSDELVVVGVMFPLVSTEWMDKFKSGPEAAFRELVDCGFPDTGFPERLRAAKLEEPVRGLLGYDNDWFQGLGQGWALVGDAVSFKDPAVGQGMHDAIYGARLLTSLLSEEEDWAGNWEQLAGRYQAAMESKLMSRYGMACQMTKVTPVTAEQAIVNQVIAANPAVTQAFLGIYNYANEPEAFGEMVMQAMQGP